MRTKLYGGSLDGEELDLEKMPYYAHHTRKDVFSSSLNSYGSDPVNCDFPYLKEVWKIDAEVHCDKNGYYQRAEFLYVIF